VEFSVECWLLLGISTVHFFGLGFLGLEKGFFRFVRNLVLDVDLLAECRRPSQIFMGVALGICFH
jgi:hypothetical protein